MDFPQISDTCSVVNDLRLPARMQECFARLRIIMRLFLHSDFVEKFFNYTLHRIEVPAAVHAQRKLLALVGKLGQRKLFRNIDRSQLIETHILFLLL